MNNEPTLNASFEEEKYTKTMIGLNIQGTDLFELNVLKLNNEWSSVNYWVS